MRRLIKSGLRVARNSLDYYRLPPRAKAEHRADRRGLVGEDPGAKAAIGQGIRWICRAQDNSQSEDGGVARHFSLIDGWSSSYPETTGYIVPTMIAYSRTSNAPEIRARARRMLDWLVSIQLPEGAFQGSVIGTTPVVPVTFNTGQVLIGLAEGVKEFNDYMEPMCRAADWLVRTQDDDGCWRNPSPFTRSGDKVYETHVAWGLFEAARLAPDAPYADAALANVRWAVTHQHDNGWFDKCCLADSARPLTHTIGYTLRGVLEAYRFSLESDLLEVARRTGLGLLTALAEDGFLPGRLDCNWRGAVRWVCLTGTVQIAHCWFLLHQYTNEQSFLQAALAASRFVRRTMKTDGPPEIRGAIKGAFPVSGGYCQYQYPNWATKFFVDVNMLERELVAD